jgi:hypothetical protein
MLARRVFVISQDEMRSHISGYSEHGHRSRHRTAILDGCQASILLLANSLQNIFLIEGIFFFPLMLSKSKITHIRSLSSKTTRHQEGLFLVEGRKCMTEFMDSDFEIVEGFFTENFVEKRKYSFLYEIITQTELDRITTLSANRDGVLIVRMKQISKMGQIPRTSE